MKCGSLVFATTQGIGILARDFYNNGILSDVLVVRHGRRAENPGWYSKDGKLPDQLFDLKSEHDLRLAKTYCDNHDSMLFIETPFLWELIPYCRSKGIKTVLMTMYECMPTILPEIPDIILCPSLLDLQYYPSNVYNSFHIPIPVPSAIVWQQRTKARMFVHNAGNGGLKGRNGTQELLQAMKYVNSPITLLLRSQVKLDNWQLSTILNDKRIVYEQTTVPYDQLYQTGDVFIFPEKFNGLSLPLQEAYASGMLVMSTNRFPMNTWLPTDPLIPIYGTRKTNVSPRCNNYDEALINPPVIAKYIDEWFERDLTEFSSKGKEWAKTMSWEVLKPRYIELLSNSKPEVLYEGTHKSNDEGSSWKNK